ncbi:MAG: TetR/AcrR family transcriptional regulator [Xanthomonadales bacterium]|nr:TetR/AcrR family transcriptional regulator [Xanthomonadales bacterium]
MKTKRAKNEADRGRGRPSDIEAGVLQDRLLDAAEQLFAERGFAATPVRRIAEAAGVNPALLHYYFGTKRDLLFAVMDRVLGPMAEAIATMQASGAAPVDDIVRLMTGMAAEHPALPKLVAREVLLSSGETREIFIRDYAPRLGGALPGLLAREQQAGRLSKDIAPGAAALMLLSLCFFPFIARSVSEPHMGVRYDADGIRDYAGQLQKVIAGGMKP